MPAFRIISAAALLAVLNGCGGDTPAPPTAVQGPGLQQLHIASGVNYSMGAVSVVDFTPNEMNYVQTWSDGRIARQYKGPIGVEEFKRIAALVETADLVHTLGVSTGQTVPCRYGEGNIDLTHNNVKYSFVIAPERHCGSTPQSSYDQLMALVNELIGKYAKAPA